MMGFGYRLNPACKEITDGSACLDPYSCQPLNH